MSSETERAYLAALVDGEGSILIQIDRRGMVNTQLVVHNTSVLVMNWLQVHFPARINHEERPPDRKRIYRWRPTCAEALLYLKLILPYLVIKQRHAEILIEFSDVMEIRGRHVRSEWKPTRARLIAEIRDLNRRTNLPVNALENR